MEDLPDGADGVIPIGVSIEAIAFHCAYLEAVRQMMGGEPDDAVVEELTIEDIEGKSIQVGTDHAVEFMKEVPWPTPGPDDEGWQRIMQAIDVGAHKAVDDVCRAFGIDPDLAYFDKSDLN